MPLPPDQGPLLSPTYSTPSADNSRPPSRRYGPTASSDPVPPTASLLGANAGSRLSAASRVSGGSRLSTPRSISTQGTRASNSHNNDGWAWNGPEEDDYLHNPHPDPKRDRKHDRGGSIFTVRGVANIGCLVLLLLTLITLFAGYPIITALTSDPLSNNGGFNVGGVNASGQVPLIPGVPETIDVDTEALLRAELESKGKNANDWKLRTGYDGQEYTLVFSDEFNKDGRTFYEGDDPFFTAVDIHYWPTGDLEWYDPSAVTTEGGHMKITMSQEPINDLQFKSGMVQSWNKLCFQYSFYIEVSVSLPGNNRVGGFWPGVWTMGNLGRPGYGASTEGMWPYTYKSCDTGTLPNQTWVNGTGPAAALTSGGGEGGALSFLPGQRLSACTCAGEDHPGPDVSVGRGSPEVDIIEAQINTELDLGEMSQSFQVAPFDDFYQFDNSSTSAHRYNLDVTHWNSYLGGVYQQAVSGVALVQSQVYQGTQKAFNVYGIEVFADPNDWNAGYISWVSSGVQSWTMKASAVGPNPRVDVNQRIVPEEPMAMIMNFGMSNNFQQVNLDNLEFPAEMHIDYVRVWQRPEGRMGCDPADHPTAKYIQDHLDAYSNPNLTTWAAAGFSMPKNRLISQC